MSINSIYSSISLLFPLSLVTIESLNFTNIQTEDYHFRNKETYTTYYDTSINLYISSILS